MGIAALGHLSVNPLLHQLSGKGAWQKVGSRVAHRPKVLQRDDRLFINKLSTLGTQ